MRLFFALWPDAEVRAALAAAAREVLLRDGRPEPAGQLHLTLRFLGDVAEAQRAELEHAAAGVVAPGFELCIAQAGWWRRSQVAWLAPREVPAALTALVAALEALPPPRADGQGFRPHLTVARRVRRVPGLAAGFEIAWPVRDFALVASHAARAEGRYEVLRRWPLAPAAQR